MKGMPRRIGAVLAAVGFTALVMFVGVSGAVALSPSAGIRVASLPAQAASGTSGTTGDTAPQRACPQTGCLSASCHGELGEPPPTSSGQASSPAANPSGAAQAASANTGVRVAQATRRPSAPAMTCPRTGCASTYCHGAHGEPPSASRRAANSAGSAANGIQTSGVDVAALQARLGLTSDGMAGPQTIAALKAFQQANGLTPDGVVGPQTKRALGL